MVYSNISRRLKWSKASLDKAWDPIYTSTILHNHRIPMSTTNVHHLKTTCLCPKVHCHKRTDRAADGIYWIRMEDLGKAVTNRCRAVQKLSGKRRKTQMGTRDRSINSEQLEFECQLKTLTRSRIQELLNLGTSSPHNLFQSLIANQDLLRLQEGMWPNHRTPRKG